MAGTDDETRRHAIQQRNHALWSNPAFRACLPGRSMSTAICLDTDLLERAVDWVHDTYYGPASHHALVCADEADRIVLVEVRRERRRRGVEVARLSRDATVGDARALLREAGGGPVHVHFPRTWRVVRLAEITVPAALTHTP